MFFGLRTICGQTLRQIRNVKIPYKKSVQLSYALSVRLASWNSTCKSLHITSTPTAKFSTQSKPYEFPYPSSTTLHGMSIKEYDLNHDEQMVKVTWKDGRSNCYPYIYLRDNCQCESCFHTECQQRLVLTMSLDLNTKPSDSHLSNDGEQLSVTWPDGHRSTYTSNWLHERRFPEEEDTVDFNKNVADENTILWDSSLNGRIPQVDFEEVMEDDIALFHWMDILSKLGLVIMSNTPAVPGQLKRLADRVGHLKSTNYGDIFEVRTKKSTTNLAYTSNYLQLHLDLPFYEYQPGIQLLHCIEQCTGEGGTNHLVDGFKVALQLKDIDPEGYKFMCTTPLTFVDVGSDDYGEYYMRYDRNIIGLNSKGNIKSFSFNEAVRDSILKIPVEKVIPMYHTYYRMAQLMYDPKNLVEKKLEPGEILTFNNRRVMHGRTAFNPGQVGSRWLQGLYFDWDCVYSKMRVIAKKHKLKTHIWS